jgi:hypothetical protein
MIYTYVFMHFICKERLYKYISYSSKHIYISRLGVHSSFLEFRIVAI